MDETLKGLYKELWVEYQNQESASIADMSIEQLTERIKKWEEIEFEARSKRQKCSAKIRELNNGKPWNPEVNPANIKPVKSPLSQGDGNYKPKAVRATKEEKLKTALGDLGVDLGDLLKDIQAKKKKDMPLESKSPEA